jgi:hypothetical protein
MADNPTCSADRCRQEGWQVNDVVTDGVIATVRITAIGEELVLGRLVSVVGGEQCETIEQVRGMLVERWHKA